MSVADAGEGDGSGDGVGDGSGEGDTEGDGEGLGDGSVWGACAREGLPPDATAGADITPMAISPATAKTGTEERVLGRL